MTDEIKTGIQRAVDQFGSVRKLADYLNLRHQNVGYWLKMGYIPPLERVREVAAITGIPHIDLVDPKIAALFPELERTPPLPAVNTETNNANA